MSYEANATEKDLFQNQYEAEMSSQNVLVSTRGLREENIVFCNQAFYHSNPDYENFPEGIIWTTNTFSKRAIDIS